MVALSAVSRGGSQPQRLALGSHGLACPSRATEQMVSSATRSLRLLPYDADLASSDMTRLQTFAHNLDVAGLAPERVGQLVTEAASAIYRVRTSPHEPKKVQSLDEIRLRPETGRCELSFCPRRF